MMFSLQSWLSSKSWGTTTAHNDTGMSRTLSRFAAMPKLVDPQELTELCGRQGFGTGLLLRLRQERRRAYLLYLAELVAEFQIFEREALDRAANDPAVDPDFAGKVLRIKFRFHTSVWLLRISLLLPQPMQSRTHQWTMDLVGTMQSARL